MILFLNLVVKLLDNGGWFKSDWFSILTQERTESGEREVAINMCGEWVNIRGALHKI
ncbi:hypothetical protein [Chitinophaga varians]|uniref:hypothetical protein n=1 Tax=Chitinophaga varians TaxID=2202339 RepID=UPI00165EE737|nr:hypothetical protein [Chitinophaga varians]MBC9911566.1 hypothetical protein [Chitinophaga varians]